MHIPRRGGRKFEDLVFPRDIDGFIHGIRATLKEAELKYVHSATMAGAKTRHEKPKYNPNESGITQKRLSRTPFLYLNQLGAKWVFRWLNPPPWI